jgi:hypothetical protein
MHLLRWCWCCASWLHCCPALRAGCQPLQPVQQQLLQLPAVLQARPAARIAMYGSCRCRLQLTAALVCWALLLQH